MEMGPCHTNSCACPFQQNVCDFWGFLLLFLTICFLVQWVMGTWSVSGSDYYKRSCRERWCTSCCGFSLLWGSSYLTGVAGPHRKFTFPNTRPPTFQRVRTPGLCILTVPWDVPSFLTSSSRCEKQVTAVLTCTSLRLAVSSIFSRAFWSYNVRSKILLFFLSASPMTEL